MYEIIEEKTTKQLNQLEIDNIIDESINLYIISDLLDLKLITEKQFYILKEKIKSFYKRVQIYTKIRYNSIERSI